MRWMFALPWWWHEIFGGGSIGHVYDVDGVLCITYLLICLEHKLITQILELTLKKFIKIKTTQIPRTVISVDAFRDRRVCYPFKEIIQGGPEKTERYTSRNVRIQYNWY